MSVKQHREGQRRFLQQSGWRAVEGAKKNGAFKWVWIKPGRRRALSREEAVAIETRLQSRSR